MDDALRYQSIDALRGVAVMGILLMNIISFSMPQGGYFSPAVYGGTTVSDLAIWAASFALVDSKMRALFSILFGASMLLVYDRAKEQGTDAAAIHFARMAWLLLFGIAHFFLVWSGDILTLYALCGMSAIIMFGYDQRQLLRAAVIFFSAAFFITAIAVISLWAERATALSDYAATINDIVSSRVSDIAADIALHRGTYREIISDKLINHYSDPLIQFLASGFETLGLMTIGMILLRNGFLKGEWADARYRLIMVRCYLIGFPPLIALATWGVISGFDPLVMIGNMIIWSLPFSICVAIGHGALAMIILRRLAGGMIAMRIAAVGRAAFTNYIGTSILMTALFYGYGLSWFGSLSRAQVYLVVPVMWLVMLAWSQPWLARFRYGPLEWLWRSLARGNRQRMRR